MIIQSSNQNKSKWTGLGRFSIFITVCMFIKNLSLLTIYAIRRFIDNKDDPPMRPRTSGHALSRVEKEAFGHIQSYLIDPHDDGIDVDGNTTVHQLMRFEPDWNTFEYQLQDLPHHLFMLNKYG